MIRVTQTQAACFILHKNYLAAEKVPNVLKLAGDLAGLPGDSWATSLLAAHVRVSNFNPSDLFSQLYQQHDLFKSDLMRNAAYIVPTAHYLTWHAATARQRNQDFNSQFRLWGIDNSEVEAVAQTILAGNNWPATAAEITAHLPQQQVRELRQTSRGGRVSKINNVELVLHWLAAQGLLGTRQADLLGLSDFTALAGLPEKVSYAPLRHWYPELDLAAVPNEAEAQAALTQAYLAAFGPASEADISFWTGFGKSETARAIGALAAKTTLTLVEGIPGMLLLLKEQAEALQSTQPPASPFIHLLPADDPFTTAYRASRSRYFNDQKLQRQIFSSIGAAQAAVVVNGQIVGTWQWLDGQLTWELLTEVDPTLPPLIQVEADRLAPFLSGYP